MCQQKINQETQEKKEEICPNCNSPIKEINLGLFSSEPLLACKCAKKKGGLNNKTSPTCQKCGSPIITNHAHGWGGRTRVKCQNPNCPANKSHTGWGS